MLLPKIHQPDAPPSAFPSVELMKVTRSPIPNSSSVPLKSNSFYQFNATKITNRYRSAKKHRSRLNIE